MSKLLKAAAVVAIMALTFVHSSNPAFGQAATLDDVVAKLQEVKAAIPAAPNLTDVETKLDNVIAALQVPNPNIGQIATDLAALKTAIADPNTGVPALVGKVDAQTTAINNLVAALTPPPPAPAGGAGGAGGATPSHLVGQVVVFAPYANDEIYAGSSRTSYARQDKLSVWAVIPGGTVWHVEKLGAEGSEPIPAITVANGVSNAKPLSLEPVYRVVFRVSSKGCHAQFQRKLDELNGFQYYGHVVFQTRKAFCNTSMAVHLQTLSEGDAGTAEAKLILSVMERLRRDMEQAELAAAVGATPQGTISNVKFSFRGKKFVDYFGRLASALRGKVGSN